MTCFHPLNAWQSPAGGPVVFSPSKTHDRILQLPCGQCIGCRVRRSADWATRCMHEAAMHESNSFITLTYDDDHLPWDGSLNKKHFQDFMKRLRFKYRPKKIRYFHCGEYGEQLRRPHYHALLFGHDFSDKQLWSEKNGIPTYVSEELDELWPFGFTTVGRVSYESAAYCARYVTKKRTGKDAEEHYWTALSTDLEVQLEPEYATMSLKPGIGETWYEKYHGDTRKDFVTNGEGKKLRIPRYYDKLLEEQSPESLAALKRRRRRQADKHRANNTRTRLRAREKCAEERLKRLKRQLEN